MKLRDILTILGGSVILMGIWKLLGVFHAYDLLITPLMFAVGYYFVSWVEFIFSERQK